MTHSSDSSQSQSTARSILKAITQRSLLRSKCGASLGEFALVAGVIFTILVGAVELSYYVYVRNAVGAALSYAVKRAQIEPNSFVELSEISDPNDQRYRNHLYARQVVADEATAQLAKAGLSNVKLNLFSYEDDLRSADGSGSPAVQTYQKQSLPIAFLGSARGGYFMMPDGTEHRVSNPNVCPPSWHQGDAGLAAGDDSRVCRTGATVCAVDDSSKKYDAVYPFVMMASFTQKVLFQELNSTVTVAGFGAAGEGPGYAAAVITESPTIVSQRPPTSTPTGTPSSTPTTAVACTPPQCADPGILSCPSGNCAGGCGFICLLHSTPTPTPTWTPTPPITCTPPPCGSADWLVCESGSCPRGCGIICRPPPPTATETPISTRPPRSTPTPTWTPTSTATPTPTATPTSTVCVDLGCGCGAPAPSGCDNKCGSTKTVDECGVCAGDGSTCHQCKIFSMNFKGSAGRGGGGLAGNGRDLESVITVGQDAPECFKNIVKEALDYCKERRRVSPPGQWPEEDMRDDCLYFYIASPNRNFYGHTFPPVSTASSRCYNCTETDEIYFDAACKPVQKGNELLCDAGEAHRVYSPISLAWDGKIGDQLQESTMVGFPLDPRSPHSTYEWKGSDRLPLLVYDPEHRGKITSAFQLFGNWTWGGQKIAALGHPATIDTRWSNGYEALATLDADGNGKVDGNELQPLGLWFDANRDGISQAGEVKAVQASGVIALYYAGPVADFNGDLRVARGFDRSVDGKIVAGESVDWFAQGAKNPSALLNRKFLASEQRSKSIVPPTSKPLESRESAGYTAKAPSAAGNFAGVWEWTADDVEAGPDQIGGYLSFKVKDGQRIVGHTYIESLLEVRPKGSDLRSIFSYRSLEGVLKTGSDRKPLLEFSVNTNSATAVTSTVRFDDDFDHLVGTSSAKLMGPAGKIETVNYHWKAKRLW